MRIKVGENRVYVIKRHPSIFVKRNNKEIQLEDCYINLYSNYGTGTRDEKTGFRSIGKHVAIIACENGEYIRYNDRLPDEINLEYLKQWGFID